MKYLKSFYSISEVTHIKDIVDLFQDIEDDLNLIHMDFGGECGPNYSQFLELNNGELYWWRDGYKIVIYTRTTEKDYRNHLKDLFNKIYPALDQMIERAKSMGHENITYWSSIEQNSSSDYNFTGDMQIDIEEKRPDGHLKDPF